MVLRRVYRFSCLLSCFFLAAMLRAQAPVFEKVFGNPLHNCKGNSVKQIASGSIYFLGANDSTGQFDLVLTKLTASGDVLWSRNYGTPRSESDGFITLTPDGQLLLLGHSMDLSTYIMGTYLAKVDTLGHILWEHIILDSTFTRSLKYIEPTADSGFIACGYTTQPNMASNDFLVMKLDSLGQVEWWEEYGYSDNDYAQMIHPTPGGGYIVSGDTQQGALYDNYILMLNDTGGIQWELVVGDEYTNGNQALLSGNDGNYYLSGESSTPLGVAFDIYMVKVTAAGQLVWANYVGYTGTDAGMSIVQSADNKFLVTGYSNSYNSSQPINVMLTKIDTAGQPLGVNYYNRPSVSIGYEIIHDLNQNYLVAGFTGNNFYLLNIKDEGYTQPFSNGFGIPAIHPSTFLAYPNPCMDMLTLSSDASAVGKAYFILDAMGKTIRSGQVGAAQFSVDVTGLSPGLYRFCLEGTTGSGVSFIRK